MYRMMLFRVLCIFMLFVHIIKPFLKGQRIEKFSYCVMSVNIAFPFDITTSGILIFILALIFIYKKNLTIWSHYKWFHINCTQFLMFQIDKCASQRYKGKIAFGYISLLKLMTTMWNMKTDLYCIHWLSHINYIFVWNYYE